MVDGIDNGVLDVDIEYDTLVREVARTHLVAGLEVMKGLNRMEPPYSLVILTSLLTYSVWTLSHPITAACVECSSTYAENEEAPSASEHSTKSASVLGVVVGESNIKDVEAKLGASPIIDTGDGAMPDVMCYKAAAQGDDTILVFIAGPLGAFEKITGIEIRTGIRVHARITSRFMGVEA